MATRSAYRPTMEFVLLGLLADRPMHGYDLYHELTGMPGLSMLWNVKQSLLYSILEKMEDRGWLSSQRIEGETRPARKEYQLTPAGEGALKEWIASPVERPREVRQVFLAKYFFARQAGDDLAGELLEKQIVVCQEWLSSLRRHIMEYSPGEDFEWAVYSFRIHQVESILAWLETCKVETGAQG